jgi:toxin ParE1/3/4
MKGLIFSDRAMQSFRDIATYSYERYGKIRGARYLDDLIEKSEGLARKTVSFRSCRDVFASDLRADLLFARSGRHYIIFTETPARIQIIDFIHQSADIGSRLGDPGE